MTQIFAGRPIPLGSFGSVMGITGLGLAWRAAAEAQHVPASGRCRIRGSSPRYCG